MAATYPHAEVIGVDLAPVPLDALQVPPNCRFEIDDANLGFPHFHGQFDVVHTRATSGGVGSPRSSIWTTMLNSSI